MKVHIVHAHPEPRSFSSAMADTALSTLTADGHSVSISDLYHMSWQAVASAADFADRSDPEYMNYAIEQRHNHQA
ncbi:MAG: NAD(P)H-dependent oxidoreductase, partial [Pseudomonadota bacterium]|nr:NAD(P)H-dependent oxidoreductase [Pseudomonadota bacterium]